MIESKVWAITSYFDPYDCHHRLPVYREFRRHLAVPLVTVELAFGDDFHLQPADADILIRLRGGSLVWQKERLLNLALQALPAHVDAVAWLDCDVVFQREDWPDALLRQLDEFEMVQLFRRLHFQSQGESLEDCARSPDTVFESVAFRRAQGSLPDEAYQMPGLSQALRYTPGAAWAARRTLLDKHGFYDSGVLGGGDKLLFCGGAGRYQRIGRWMSPAHQRHFSHWAASFHRSVKGRISHIDGNLVHLWHGDLKGRRYYDRLKGFERFEFDPERDLSLTRDGVWQWSSDKREMHSFVGEHLSLVGRSAGLWRSEIAHPVRPPVSNARISPSETLTAT